MTAGTRLRVLFVSHEASRTGAPMRLLDLIRWLVVHGDVRPTVLLRRGGVLVEEFERHAPTHVFSSTGARRIRPLIPGLWSPSNPLSPVARFLRRHGPFDVVLSNTVANGPLVSLLGLDAPIITYAREMGFAIDNHVGPDAFSRTAQGTTRWIACAEAVREALTQRGVPNEDIVVIPSPARLDVARLGSSARASVVRRGSSSVVVSAGSVTWGKGFDLFISTAYQVVHLMGRHDVEFVWVGGGATAEARYDVAHAGLEDHVQFIGARDDAADIIAGADVFFLSSREDSYAVVMTEAGAAGVPVVAFNGSGGADEYVAAGGGAAVPYLDVRAAAERIVSLIDDPSERERMGAAGAELVRTTRDTATVSRLVLAELTGTAERANA